MAEGSGPAAGRILGIDPGLARAGWSVIEGSGACARVIEYGTISTGRDLPHADRLLRIFRGLQEVIERHRPEVMAVEEVFQGKSPKSSFLAGEGRGACILAGATAGLRVVEYPAAVVKVCITGNGRAAKVQVQAMVRRLLGLPEPPRPHDAADALAVALTHMRRRSRPIRLIEARSGRVRE